MTEVVFALAAVLGAVVGFRLGAAARRSPEGKVAATNVSRVLMLGAIAVGSPAAAAIVAERGPGEPAPVAAWFLFGAAGVVLAGASGLGFAARTPVEGVSTRGRALVRSIREEGPSPHGIPVWTLDLDVTAPGIEPFRTEIREEIPYLMVPSVEEGRHFPVSVEKTPRRVEVALDWVASPHAAEPGSPVPVAIPPGPPLAEQARSSAVSRYARVLLPIGLIAALSLLAARFLESAGDAEPRVVPSGTYESTVFDPPG